MAARTIENEDAMQDLLRDAGYVTEEFATKTLAQRMAALRDTAVIVTQIGANALNVLFAEPPPCALLYLRVGHAPSPQIDAVAPRFWDGRPRVIVRYIDANASRDAEPVEKGRRLDTTPRGLRNFDARQSVDLTQLSAAVGDAAKACY